MNISSTTWRNLKLGLAVLTAGIIVAACGGSNTATAPVVETPPNALAAICDDAATKVTFSAPAAGSGSNNLLALATGGSVVSGKKSLAAVVPPAIPANSMRIHYQRRDKTYTNWTIWAFDGLSSAGNKTWATGGATATGTDDYGVYWDIPVVDATLTRGFTLNGGGVNDTDANGNKIADREGFVIAKGTEVWTWDTDKSVMTKNPDLPVDVDHVTIHFKKRDGNYKGYNTYVWSDTGAGDVVAVNGITPPTVFSDAIKAQPYLTYDGPDGNPNNHWPGFPFVDANNAPIAGMTAVANGWATLTIPTIPYSAGARSMHWIVNGPNGQTGNLVLNLKKGNEVWLKEGDSDFTYGPTAPVLNGSNAAESRALWVDKRNFMWPLWDNGSNFTYKLYVAKAGGMTATIGATTVAGSDAEYVLQEDATGSAISAQTKARFSYVSSPTYLTFKTSTDADSAAVALTKQMLLVQFDKDGKVYNSTSLQTAGVLDDLYAANAKSVALGVAYAANAPASVKLWAPTAQKVNLCVYDSAAARWSSAGGEMTKDAATGVWSIAADAAWANKLYKFAVDVYVVSTGKVEHNLVTDPYSTSLTANSFRSQFTGVDDPATKPAGWGAAVRPTLPEPSAMSVYQTHIRDFSVADGDIDASKRGKFVAFADPASAGMKHLKLLANAGLTHVQFLPVYDGGSVDELGCVSPKIDAVTDGASTVPAETILAVENKDCFNWGFDPVHYGAIDGTYSTNPTDGAVRMKEFREAVMALHKANLRVITDMVYNHTYQSGQGKMSILDRIVPGYYHRLSETGAVIKGFGVGLDNTASENAMFEKLMIDTAVRFAVDYKVDSFRFDWMSDHSVGTMKRLRQAVIDGIKAKETNVGADNFYIFGEGWGSGATQRFGGDPDGDKEAGQQYIAGTGLGVFNDRIRDGMRGVSYDAQGAGMLEQQGWTNGRWYDVNNANKTKDQAFEKLELFSRLNMVRSGMTGGVKDFDYPYTQLIVGSDGKRTGVFNAMTKTGNDLSSGYHAFTTNPQESVNYVAVHDNRTLYDYNTLVLPVGTTMADRVRVQALNLGTIALSQGMAFFTQGSDILISKDFDNDSYNSGDWFNQVFWNYTQNNFGIGLPNVAKNSSSYAAITPLLQNAALKPAQADIIKSRDLFIEMLKLRYSSPLFHLKTGADVKARFKFYNADTEAGFDPTFIVQRLDDECTGCADLDRKVKSLVVVINVDKQPKTYTNADLAGKAYVLSTAHADTVVKQGASFDNALGKLTVPARSVAVFVDPQ